MCPWGWWGELVTGEIGLLEFLRDVGKFARMGTMLGAPPADNHVSLGRTHMQSSHIRRLGAFPSRIAAMSSELRADLWRRLCSPRAASQRTWPVRRICALWAPLGGGVLCAGKDSVRARLEGDGMSFTEFTYQLLQGYDFVHLHREHQVSVQVAPEPP